ncbi:hypothetical protein CMO83_00955 [Candidatus Woesearchaeota archaeon]|jgi:hypothetical protein|nr:hypothetical protein [Candidatus Woesearchaeota archaeon]|tara:strand:- start:259 stop:2091 length:1833 start_codon:yes stop_codon:yes gene_type:complete
MADPQPEQPKEKKEWKWPRRLKNLLVFNINKLGVSRKIQSMTGTPLTYARYKDQPILDPQPVSQELIRRKDLLTLNESLMVAVSEVENRWEETDKLVFGSKKTGAEGFEDDYRAAMIFLDGTTSLWEYALHEGEKFEDGFDDAKDPDWRRIKIFDKTYWFPVPHKYKIRYPMAGLKREWIVEISPFGYRAANQYIKRYQRIVKEICDDAKEKWIHDYPDKEDNIRERLDYVQTLFERLAAELIGDYCGYDPKNPQQTALYDAQFEVKMRGFMKEASELSGKIPGKKSQLYATEKKLGHDEIDYYSSYQVIEPIIYGEKEKSGEVIDDIRNHGWVTRDGEPGPGLDKFSYPLEVDYDGIVMLDKRNGDPNPRLVPKQFIKDIDLLERAQYVANWHDTYRDSLRDGRYHNKTLTVMDYVQAKNPSIWNLWHMINEKKLIKGWIKPGTPERRYQTEMKMNLTHRVPKVVTAGIPEVPSPITYLVNSTDKNPAFDMRALHRPWKYAGRKYYYDTPDASALSKDPHISSRGISMYIIENVTRQYTRWSEVNATLNEIGLTFRGFDYGPRPWDMWGKEEAMPLHPYEWSEKLMERINQPMPDDYGPQDYKEKYKLP